MSVDLLIVNYNTKNLLRRVLDTLHLDFEDGVWEIYLQDNGSTDGSVEWIEKHLVDYNVTSVTLAENVGYAAAINSMAKQSSNEILAAINADTWFTTKHVKQMLQTFEDYPEQAICGPKQMDEQDRIRHGGIVWNGPGTGPPKHRGWAEVDKQDKLYKDRIKCWTVSGSLYYVRREVWETMTQNQNYQTAVHGAEGAFLPTPHFFEETFCSVHAQHLGYEVWYDGTIETAGHSWHASEAVGEPSRKFWDISRNMYIRTCEMIGIENEFTLVSQ